MNNPLYLTNKNRSIRQVMGNVHRALAMSIYKLKVGEQV